MKNASRAHRRGLTLIEILVSIGIISVLISLTTAAVMSARAKARSVACANKLRQLSTALHLFESSYGHFPEGKSPGNLRMGEVSWLTRLLPYVEQAALYEVSQTAYDISADPFRNPPHSPLAAAVPVFGCPEDGRVDRPRSASSLDGAYVGLTSYLGVSGTDPALEDGVLMYGRQIQTRDIRDGLSNTVIAGERPPSPDYNLGWWYAGVGHDGWGNAEMYLSVTEPVRTSSSWFARRGCPDEGRFQPGRTDNPCDALNFWSLHDGGAYFAFCDGSVKFLSYQTGTLQALAARNDGE